MSLEESPSWWPVLRFCAQEVERQRDTPEHVYFLMEAWDFALSRIEEHRYPDYEDIMVVGKLVSPYLNKALVPRHIPIRIGSRSVPWQTIPTQLKAWVEAVAERRINAEEAYKEFEEIHPFHDGNGRAGKVLYNWINDTLLDPQMPPNFWGTSNP